MALWKYLLFISLHTILNFIKNITILLLFFLSIRFCLFIWLLSILFFFSCFNINYNFYNYYQRKFCSNCFNSFHTGSHSTIMYEWIKYRCTYQAQKLNIASDLTQSKIMLVAQEILQYVVCMWKINCRHN